MIRRRLFRSLLAVLLAAAWCHPSVAVASASDTAVPTGDGKLTIEPHTFTARDGTEVAAERGRLTVPMRRGTSDTGQDSATVELAFVRFPSTTTHPASPIVYLAGGPGGSGISAASGSRFPLFQALRSVGDVIALDQRGTGDSTPAFDCNERYMVPLDQPGSPEVATPILADAARRCMESAKASGIDPAGYNTLENAADLEALRVALGAEKLTLWGISYGTHLALATLKSFPDSIDRVILAGVEPLHHSWKLPSDQQALLQAISRRAAADPTIGERMPDLFASVGELLSQLEAHPVTVSMTHPQSGQTFPVTFGPFDLQVVVANMLANPESFAPLPDLLARLQEGDWLALGLAAARGRFGEIESGMPFAMDCASGASDAWTARIAREAQDTLLGDAINFPFPGICSGVDVPDLGESYRAPVRSDVPALLISGTLDGRTPPANAEGIRPGLPHSVHLVLEGAGHSDPLFLSSPKILETMLAFLRGEPVKDQRIEVPVPAFLPLRHVEPQPAEVLARYVGDYEIREGEYRRAVLAGDVIYTVRGNGPPFPLRPMSSTRFFYEGSATWLDFELDSEGKTVAMIVHHDGAAEGERAAKVE